MATAQISEIGILSMLRLASVFLNVLFLGRAETICARLYAGKYARTCAVLNWFLGAGHCEAQFKEYRE